MQRRLNQRTADCDSYFYPSCSRNQNWNDTCTSNYNHVSIINLTACTYMRQGHPSDTCQLAVTQRTKYRLSKLRLFIIRMRNLLATSFGRKGPSSSKKYIKIYDVIYRVIHKSLRDFRTRVRNNQDRHGRKEHINR